MKKFGMYFAYCVLLVGMGAATVFACNYLMDGSEKPSEEVISNLAIESEMRAEGLVSRRYENEGVAFCQSYEESSEIDYTEAETTFLVVETVEETVAETVAEETTESETTLEETVESSEEYEHDAADFRYIISWSGQELTVDEFELMCRCVELEVGTEGYDTRYMVALTILNRKTSTLFPNDIYGVVFQTDQYGVASTDAIYTYTISDATRSACLNALESNAHPSDLFYFRSAYYFDFGVPYMELNGVWFSRQG